MERNTDTNIQPHKPEATSPAKAIKYLTNQGLADFRKCPSLYHENSRRAEWTKWPGDHMDQVVHCAILEKADVLWARYAVGGPVNPVTKKFYDTDAPEFAAWAAAHGKPVLMPDQLLLSCWMNVGVVTNRQVQKLLKKGVAGAVLRADYRDVACKIHMDWLNPDRGIVDFRICDDLSHFEAEARRRQYAHDVAFSRSVLAEHIGWFPACYIVAVENREPHRCGVWQIGEETLRWCANDNDMAIDRLKECRRLNKWPTGYEEIRVFDALK